MYLLMAMAKYYIPKDKFEAIGKEKIDIRIAKARNDADFCRTLILSWLVGSRIAEAVRFKRDDFIIDDEKAELTIVLRSLKHGKTGYPSFSFTDPFVPELITYIKSLAPDAYFTKRRSTSTYQKILLKLNKELYPNDTAQWITFHMCRHGRITYLAFALQASPAEIKSWTGHRSSAYEEYFQPRKTERFRGKIA